MNSDATTAMAVKSQRCQPSAPARKLNAAPGLKASTRLKNGVRTNDSCGRKLVMIQCFVTWSSTMTPAVTASHARLRTVGGATGAGEVKAFCTEARIAGNTRFRSCERPRLARSEQVRDAAPAKGWVLGIPANVGAIVPAALALRMRRTRNRELEAVRVPVLDLRARSDQHEAQVMAQARERIEVRLAGADDDVGLQRRADLTQFAPLLDAFERRLAYFQDSLPLRNQRSTVRNRRQHVLPLVHEDRRILRIKDRPGLFGGERENRCHQLQQRIADRDELGLRRAARSPVLRRGIEAVLQDVDVEPAQVLRAIRLQLLDDQMKLIGVVRRFDRLGHHLRARERVAVDLEQIGYRHGMAGR